MWGPADFGRAAFGQGAFGQGAFEPADFARGDLGRADLGQISAAPRLGELRWLFIDLNSFFASCEQAVRPELRQRPVGVVPLLTAHTCLIAASIDAKRRGCKTGTLVHEAVRLCPDIMLVPARPRLYVQYHEALYRLLQDIFDNVEVCSIDEFAVALPQGCTVAQAAILARKLKEKIRLEFGDALTCSIGGAPNKLLAKLASDMQKPDGLVFLPIESLPQKILPLKLNDVVGVGRQIHSRLLLAGIDDMARLWAASSQQLRLVWGGVQGLRFWLDFHGYDIRPAATTKRIVSHQHVLEPEYRSAAGALMVARQLLHKAALRLLDYGFMTQRLSLSAKLIAPKAYWEVSHSMAATNSIPLLLNILGQLWQKFPTQAVPLRMSVVCSDLQAVAEQQLDLFAEKIPTPPPVLTTELQALTKKYGRGKLAFGLPARSQSEMRDARIAFSRVPEMAEF